jgi:hypothetical protein
LGFQLVVLLWQITAAVPMLAYPCDVGYTHSMQVLHSDKRKRVTLPNPAEPGDSWISEVVTPNQILLTRIEPPARSKAKIAREGKLIVGVSAKTITWEETRRALDEFP